MNEKRIIKFRAWDGSKMYDVLRLFFNSDGAWAADGDVGHTSRALFSNEIIFMQFTGMLDKNKQPIYEGDILKCKAKAPKRAGQEFNNVVDYYEGITFHGFRLKNGRFTSPLTPSRLYNNEAEIIGNIYENPELLKF